MTYEEFYDDLDSCGFGDLQDIAQNYGIDNVEFYDRMELIAMIMAIEFDK